MSRALRPVKVAGIEFDALIDEQRQLDAEIPQFTTEEGFKISDAVIIDAETISMTLYTTDTPVTWRGIHGGRHADNVCHRLEQVYFAKEPITIETTDAVYNMMAIESITFQKTLEIGYSKEIPVTFRKVRKTAVRTVSGLFVSSSYGSGGSTGVSAGSANTTTKGSDGSIAYSLDVGTGGVISDALGGAIQTVTGWLS